MRFREHFRDLKEWSSSTDGKITLNTASDLAAKEYDAALTQLCGLYEDPNLDGFMGTVNRLQNSDPDFILGQAFLLELNLLGAMNGPHLDESIAKKIASFNALVKRKKEQDQTNMHELLHADLVNHFAKNNLLAASYTLEKLATCYPDDILALKLNQDTYMRMGTMMSSRNCLAGSLQGMSAKNPLLGYVHGMYAFALEESNMYQRSQEESLKALNLIPTDTWAIHSYAHCLEMQGQSELGLEWMASKKSDWDKCSMLASHQYWHTALFHINEGNYHDAVALLDDEVLPRFLKDATIINLHDATSLVYRMDLVDLFGKLGDNDRASIDARKKRWGGIHKICQLHSRDHLSGFNDAHYMMGFLGADDLEGAQQLFSSIDDIPADQLANGKTVVRPLLEAMYEYKRCNYDKCVSLLEDIRFDIIRIGNSHAQRDVFEQLLLLAALRSNDPDHNKLAKRMLNERAAFAKQKYQFELLKSGQP